MTKELKKPINKAIEVKHPDICLNCENSGNECSVCGGFNPRVIRINKGICLNCDNSGLDCSVCGGYKK